MRDFISDTTGNFALVAAILTVPIVLAVGLAVDYASITTVRSDLQSALDSAALAIQSEVKEVSNEDANALAREYLRANYADKFEKVQVLRAGTSVRVSAQTQVQLAFGTLMGYSQWPVVAASSADVAFASYEIALVLDTTGSMKGGKLVSMKDAVLGLIDTMSLDVKDDKKLQFAMVPFAAFVNVGAQYGPSFDKNGDQLPGTGAEWLDLSGNSSIPQSELDVGASRFQLYSNVGKTWPGCVETRYAPGKDFDIDDTIPDPAKAATLFVPAFGIDEPDLPQYANSYITSDAKPNDKTVKEKKKRWTKYGVTTTIAGKPKKAKKGATVVIDTSASKLDGLPKGPGHGCDVQPIVPLTSDYKGLKAKINALQASGTTNIMEGVAWGNRVLSPGAPFAETKSAKATQEQIMIVLTDGSNVFGNTPNDLGSSYSSAGYLVDGRLGIAAGGSSATNALMNVRTLKACDTAKAAGIEIYTIRLEEPNVTTGSMLKECASSPDNYFDVPSRSQLDEVFSKIGKKISRVRISS